MSECGRMHWNAASTSGLDAGAENASASGLSTWSNWIRGLRGKTWSIDDQQLHARVGGGIINRRIPGVKITHASTTFYWLHVAYFGVLTLIGTMSLWWCRERPSISFVDCIFNAVSALTVTGLSSLRVRDFSTLGMVVLMLLMILGSNVFTSLLPLYIRRFHFYRYNLNLTFSSTSTRSNPPCSKPNGISTSADHLALPIITSNVSPANTDSMTMDDNATPYIEAAHTTGSDHDTDNVHDCEDCRYQAEHNTESTQFSGSSGGSSLSNNNTPRAADHHRSSLEQQALITLCRLVPIYMFTFQFIGFVAIICYNGTLPHSSQIRQLYSSENINPTFFALFASISAFSNTGLSPLDENMVPFQSALLILVLLSLLILAGNTMFPPFMRAIIWGLCKWPQAAVDTRPRQWQQQRDVYEYLLRYPRRCFTHLFPRLHTGWLVGTVVAFNTVMAAAFCVLEWRNGGVPRHPAAKVVDAAFQSINTRSAGMNVVALDVLSPAMLVLYIGMMYIAVYPVFLSRQNTRIFHSDVMYHESDMCIFGKSREVAMEDNKLSVQSQKLLARDSAYIFTIIFLICTLEKHNITSDPFNYTIFNIFFEVISAYGNVGLSIGYSCGRWRAFDTTLQASTHDCEDVPYSFSGKWSPSAKLLLVVVMLLGRHRGLPDNIDSTIYTKDSLQCRLHQSQLRF